MFSLALTLPVRAQTQTVRIDINAAPLADALQALARETGADLLFDRGQVDGLRGPAVHGRLTTRAALQDLLAGTKLQVRRAASGALILEVPATQPLAQPDVVVPEVLVIGRRTQNADIRRYESDIQPYKITTTQDLANAHRDTIDDFFRSRVTANTQATPGILAARGDTRSSIDLRGLGSQDTLVLVDGRRMPGLPTDGLDFTQADLNGIPLSAVRRIETLTGTAGGIYGFGALGGVVNVVLDRDLRGLQVTTRQGLTSRGDAYRQSFETNFGRTFNDGRTDVTLSASVATSEPLLSGDRDYLVRSRERSAAGDPTYVAGSFLPGNSVGVFSPTFEPLVFKPGYGGGTLPSGYTFLPAGFSGNMAALASGLTQHQGQLDSSLPNGEADSTLGSWSPWSAALLFNARHRFGDTIEAYVDVMVLANTGRSDQRGGISGILISPDSPVNPFTGPIETTFTTPGSGQFTSQSFETTRYTAGVTFGLPFQWRGTAEAGWGAYVNSERDTFVDSTDVPFEYTGDPSDLDVNPFGDWTTFEKAVSAHQDRLQIYSTLRDNFQEQSLRLAGPIFKTDAGLAMLTLMADRYRQVQPVSTQVETDDFDGTSTTFLSQLASQSTTTVSFSGELRAPIFGDTAPIPMFRALELQLAVRNDQRVDHFENNFLEPDSEKMKASFSAVAYTVGAKVSPVPGLMLRASYATGEEPPLLDSLREIDFDFNAASVADPKRGGFNPDATGAFHLLDGGNIDLKAIRASTLSFGAVVTPFGPAGARFSIDYSHIRRTGDVVAFPIDLVLEHEDDLPGRVVRAPLTDEDRANGYTGGEILSLDARAANAGSLDVQTIDASFAWPLTVLDGRLTIHGAATYYLNNRAEALFQPTIEHVGYEGEPLHWRATAGAEWTRKTLTVGVDVQYFGDYRAYGTPDHTGQTIDPDIVKLLQGSLDVPAQTYVDLYMSWRVAAKPLHLPGDLVVDFGVVNVFDTSPPLETTFYSATDDSQGISRYGDPRRRRFELSLTTKF